jgi:hypothetical protein
MKPVAPPGVTGRGLDDGRCDGDRTAWRPRPNQNVAGSGWFRCAVRHRAKQDARETAQPATRQRRAVLHRRPRYSVIDAHPAGTPAWLSNFGLIASVATKICSRTQQTPGFAPSNARSAPNVSRLSCATSARIAAADLPLAQFGQRRNGGPVCRSKSAHHRPGACACHTASRKSLRSRNGSKILRRRIARSERR